MSYQPIVLASGNLGWTFLKNTRDDQQEAFDNSSLMSRNATYFSEKIGEITSAEDLVNDRRLLEVALGAFGLDDDINSRFFIQKVLEEGTLGETAFANRLSDKRYFAMAEAFGFDLAPPRTVLSTFAEDIINQYRTRQFEVAVGETDSDLRLALGAERELNDLADRSLSEDAGWFTIMGNPPMRRVFEMALGLPSELAAIDIDQQLREFRDKSEAIFGATNPADFADPELQEKLIQNFLFRTELENSSSISSSGTVALSLLQTLTPQN